MKIIIILLLARHLVQQSIIPILINEKNGRKTQFILQGKKIEFFNDLLHSYSFLSLAEIKLSKSTVKVKENKFKFNFQNHKYEAYIMKDNITEISTNTTIKDIHFYYGKNFSPFFPHLGLGYKIIDPKMSIVYKSYEQGLINRRSFGLKLYNSEENEAQSYLYLGGISKVLRKKYKYNASCSVNSKYNSWGCNLASIRFLDYVYYENEYLYFQLIFEYSVSVSNNFLKFFNKKVEDRKANLEEKKIMNFPIFFNFGSFEMEIKKCIQVLPDGSFNITTQNSGIDDKWIGSKYFFRLYGVLFDYDLNMITFYSKKHFKKKTKKIFNITLIVIDCFILIYGIILNSIDIFLIPKKLINIKFEK